MVERPSSWARATAHSLLGRSYTLSRRYALVRMARRREPPTVVLSMGKTGSTAIARAVQQATGRPVFQVFRLEPTRLREAEQRYRERRRTAPTPGADSSRAVAFPGARVRHLAWAYPVATTLIVMATGHHFLADAVAAALLVRVAWAVSRAFGARGPDGQPATLGWELQWGRVESH